MTDLNKSVKIIQNVWMTEFKYNTTYIITNNLFNKRPLIKKIK